MKSRPAEQAPRYASARHGEEPFELDDDDASVAALSDDDAIDEQEPRTGESSGKGKGKEKRSRRANANSPALLSFGGLRGRRVTPVSSLRSNRLAAQKLMSAEMTEVMQKHAFVGLVDRDTTLSLMQYSTKLFLVDHAKLGSASSTSSRAIATNSWQGDSLLPTWSQAVWRLQSTEAEPPPDIRQLLHLAAADDPGIPEAGLSVDTVVAVSPQSSDQVYLKRVTMLTRSQEIYETLMDKREMLDEYFSLQLSPEGELQTLPLLLRGYTPDLDRLPQFLLCIGAKVSFFGRSSSGILMPFRSTGRLRKNVSRRSCGSWHPFTLHDIYSTPNLLTKREHRANSKQTPVPVKTSSPTRPGSLSTFFSRVSASPLHGLATSSRPASSASRQPARSVQDLRACVDGRCLFQQTVVLLCIGRSGVETLPV